MHGHKQHQGPANAADKNLRQVVANDDLWLCVSGRVWGEGVRTVHVVDYMYYVHVTPPSPRTFCSSFRASNRSVKSLGATTFLINKCKVGAHTHPHRRKRRALALRFVTCASKCSAVTPWATELPKLARSREHWSICQKLRTSWIPFLGLNSSRCHTHPITTCVCV